MMKRNVWFDRLVGAWVLGAFAVGGWGITSADTPDQAAHGAEVYAMRCITCHGDRGQGLALWRLTWDAEHQNCSQPKCHGPNHPSDGFYLPNNYAPAIMGDNTLTRFRTAHDLHAFISRRMPYQEPGILPADDYWALSAYILRERGVLPPGLRLDATTAGAVLVNPNYPLPLTPGTPASVRSSPPVLIYWLAVGSAVGAVVVLGLVFRSRSRGTRV